MYMYMHGIHVCKCVCVCEIFSLIHSIMVVYQARPFLAFVLYVQAIQAQGRV